MTLAAGPGDVTAPGLRSVVIVLQASVRPLEVVATWELLGAGSDVRFAGTSPGSPVPLLGTGRLTPRCGLEAAVGADLVFLAPTEDVPGSPDATLVATLREAVAHGSRVMAVDTSVFTLADAGLLAGRAATTHWSLAGRFRDRFPDVELRAESIYVEDGPVLTAAGAIATIDLCLHVIAATAGTTAVSRVERQFLTGPRRSGRFGQRLDLPGGGPTHHDGITDLLSWISAHLHETLTLDRMARRAFMSRRSLTRRFREATGTTPYAWILEERVRRAQDLLATRPDLTIEEVATRTGFGTAGVLRQHFQRAAGCTPTEYREAARS